MLKGTDIIKGDVLFALAVVDGKLTVLKECEDFFAAAGEEIS